MGSRLEDLKKLVFSEDSDLRIAAFEEISSFKGKEVVIFLISLLDSHDSKICNPAAMALGEIGDNCAVNPLMRAIRKREANNRGTLVYSLTFLDCSNLLLPMIDFALYGNYEVQNHAIDIISNQRFKTNREEINIGRDKIKGYLKDADRCEDWESLISDLEGHLLRIEDDLETEGDIL